MLQVLWNNFQLYLCFDLHIWIVDVGYNVQYALHDSNINITLFDYV